MALLLLVILGLLVGLMVYDTQQRKALYYQLFLHELILDFENPTLWSTNSIILGSLVVYASILGVIGYIKPNNYYLIWPLNSGLWSSLLMLVMLAYRMRTMESNLISWNKIVEDEILGNKVRVGWYNLIVVPERVLYMYYYKRFLKAKRVLEGLDVDEIRRVMTTVFPDDILPISRPDLQEYYDNEFDKKTRDVQPFWMMMARSWYRPARLYTPPNRLTAKPHEINVPESGSALTA